MKQKGFTLVELLTVIAILAVILLISVPQILNVLETSKRKAAESSATIYIKEVNRYASSNLIYGENSFVNGSYYVGDLSGITISGTKPTDNSWLTITDNKVTAYSFKLDDYIVNFDGSSVVVNKYDEASDNVILKKPVSPILKHMNGVNWYFDSDSAVEGSNTWPNVIEGYADFNITGNIVKDDDSVYITGQTNSQLILEQQDSTTVYIVGKSGDSDMLITGTGGTKCNLINIGATSGKLRYSSYVNQIHFTSTVESSTYNVIAVTYDAVNKVSKFYINGSLVYDGTNNGYYTPNYWLGNYGSWYKTSQIWYKLVVIGNELHSNEQVIENMNILATRYGIN